MISVVLLEVNFDKEQVASSIQNVFEYTSLAARLPTRLAAALRYHIFTSPVPVLLN
ncbi:hypothetical protein O9993_09955 [Vibrio lentus]|nr:hypothetical protein [Vibrio lentus]